MEMSLYIKKILSGTENFLRPILYEVQISEVLSNCNSDIDFLQFQLILQFV